MQVRRTRWRLGSKRLVAPASPEQERLVAERTETQILRDPFTHKPFVHFYATKRVGGQVSNSEAIKLMKFSA